MRTSKKVFAVLSAAIVTAAYSAAADPGMQEQAALTRRVELQPAEQKEVRQAACII